jgi:hypothetical protein
MISQVLVFGAVCRNWLAANVDFAWKSTAFTSQSAAKRQN